MEHLLYRLGILKMPKSLWKEVAEYYALGAIALIDVEYLLKIPAKRIPKEFFEYADEYYNKYEEWMISNYTDQDKDD